MLRARVMFDYTVDECVAGPAHGTSDSKTLPEYSRDPHAMERNAHTACCVRV